MGLDMYFTRRLKRKRGEKETREEAMYWRKANAIHKWFIDNIQDGEDDQKMHKVTKEDLQELLSTINTVLEDHSKAAELLPTQSGFFFGDTEYGDYYYKYLQDTKEMIERELKNDDISYFFYSCWW